MSAILTCRQLPKYTFPTSRHLMLTFMLTDKLVTRLPNRPDLMIVNDLRRPCDSPAVHGVCDFKLSLHHALKDMFQRPQLATIYLDCIRHTAVGFQASDRLIARGVVSPFLMTAIARRNAQTDPSWSDVTVMPLPPYPESPSLSTHHFATPCTVPFLGALNAQNASFNSSYATRTVVFPDLPLSSYLTSHLSSRKQSSRCQASAALVPWKYDAGCGPDR